MSSMGIVVATEALAKSYGPTPALQGLDLEVRRGEVYGFIGPNGAGKSTTIRILLDLLRPSSGSAKVLGATPRAGGAALRARIGYLPGELHLGANASAAELLRHLAAVRGGRGRNEIEPLAERFRLDLSRPVRALSKGNKQKVGLIQAFMHHPELLILDEPTSGLDPLLQHEFLTLLRERSEEGATVFMSSHVLREVESVADRVGVIKDGRMVDVDSVTGLRRRAGQRVRFRFSEPPDPDAVRALAGVEAVKVVSDTLECIVHGEPDALLKWAARFEVIEWHARDRDLEELFLDVYRNHGAPHAP
jgi:ABC-2 type transport system ATP-binding protein